MTPEYVITSPSRHHIDGHHNHYSSRHVHFNNNNKHSIDPEEASHSNNNNNNLEVSCDNPTQLFLLMNQQLWDSAIIQLQNNPTEARTWITSRTTDGECKWSHLPLHLACLHGPTPAPLQFIEALINTYPHGVQCRNHEDNLPIHLACDCINFNPQFGLQVEGILGMLIQKYPECLNLKDGMGRRPIDILEERGICDKDKMKQSVGRGLSIIKYIKTMGKRSRKKNLEGSPRSLEKRDDEVKPRRGSPRNNLPDHPMDVMATKERENMERMYPQTMAAQRRFNNNKQQAPLPYLPRDGTSAAAHQSTSPHVDQELVIKSHPLQAVMSPLSNHHIPSTSVPSPYNGHPVSMCTSPSARLNMDPFHYLEAELSSLRGEHQTMEHLLNVKTQSEVDLQNRLSKLMKENEQMKLDYDYLSNKHSETQTKLNETTKALESSNYELKIKKKQEKNASSELALKMAVEDKQNVEIKKLISTLKKEKVARVAAVEKLETQMKQQIGLEESMEKITLQNSEADTLNDTLKAEIKELQAELAQRNEECNHSKSQEIKLLGLLSNMPDQDIVEERKELSSENRELQKELQQTKTKSIEMKIMLVNLNEKYTESQKEIKELQSQLADQKNGINQLLWGEDKVKESSLVEDLRAKNKALREVALKAISTTVQQRIDSPSRSTDTSGDDLHELLKNAENTKAVVGDSTHSDDLDDNQVSLEMLRPVVSDAVKVQQDAIENIQKLLTQTKATKKLTEKITCSDIESLDFEFSLKIVEQITSSSMKMIESIDIMSKSTELSKSKLVSLLNLQPEDAEALETCDGKEDTDDEEALKKSTRVNEIAAKHLQELENLKTIMSQIPTLKLDKADRQDARKHLELVDSITSVLNNALSKLVRDARQLKLENLTFI